MDFTVPADCRVEMKKGKRYPDTCIFPEKQKCYEIWKWRWYRLLVAFELSPRVWKKRVEELEVQRRTENIQATGLLISVRVLRRFLESWGHLLSPRWQWNTPIKTGVKIWHWVIIMQKMNASVGMTSWEWWSTGNCARDKRFV